MIEEDNKIDFRFDGEIEIEEMKIEKTKNMILELLKEADKCRKEIVEILIPQFIAERTIDRALKELREEKKIVPNKVKNSTYYNLAI